MKKDNTCSVMIDGLGNAVPTKYVSAYDKMRDKKVRQILDRARKLRTDMENFMIFAVEAMNEVAGQKKELGVKGNFSCRTFDGLLRVDIAQQYNIFLDERVVRAREKMFSYVERVLARVNQNDAAALKVIIESAFRVGSNGMLSQSKVHALLQMNINDADWCEAQELLRNSLTPSRGKRYLRVFARDSHDTSFKQLLLDTSDCWPKESGVAK